MYAQYETRKVVIELSSPRKNHHRFTIDITDEMNATLNQLSKDHHFTKTAIIREVLQRYLPAWKASIIKEEEEVKRLANNVTNH